MKHIKAIVSIVLMLLAVILIAENLDQLSNTLTLRVHLYFWEAKTPPMAFYLVIIIVFLLGVLIASFYGIYERFRLKKEIRILSKTCAAKDKELNSLRNLPIIEGKTEGKAVEAEEQV